MEQKHNNTVTYLLLLLAVTLWGFSFIWTNDLIRQDVPIFIFVFLRITISGCVLMLFSKLTGKLQKVKKKDWKWFLLISFFEPFIYFIGESYGMKTTDSATLSSVVIATIPIFTLILGQIIYKEPLTKLNIIGVVITLPGILIFMWNGGSVKPEYLYGLLFLAIAVAGSVGYGLVCKRLTSDYNAYTITSYQFFISIFFFLIPFLLWGLPAWRPGLLTFSVIKPLLCLALLCSCLAFVLYVKSIDKVGMTKTVIFNSLSPVISAIVAYFSGRESLSYQQVIGIAVVLCGVILAQFKTVVRCTK